MKTLSPAEVLARFHWRYAVKKFDTARRIPDDVWQAIEDTLVLTPSSFGLQPWKFIVITDQAIKASLVPCSWGQCQPSDCSHMVVFAARTDLNEPDIDAYLARIAEVRNTTVEALKGFRKAMTGTLLNENFDSNEWAARQCYIAIGQLMAIAAVMGVDTCPMEGFDTKKYDDILGLPAMGYRSVISCPVGYRAADDKYAAVPKVRFKSSDVVVRI
ncbi:NAD(P)H-dependent oxidoreductase [Zavarzinella formosa]|uniref:NAD(P)H-dependent oxidoreductase n=1 Tax=Zavarzinella formosa TaxID=360055 RepID=UPI000304041C|nr:NAD(P)H-dependent oxidoreductase [Zavarzinella formosa]